jgi:hypothetical protein
MLSIPNSVCPGLLDVAALASVHRQKKKSVTAMMWEEKFQRIASGWRLEWSRGTPHYHAGDLLGENANSQRAVLGGDGPLFFVKGVTTAACTC